MDQRLSQLLQLASWAMLAWFAYGLLGRLHPILELIVVLIALVNVVVVWAIRYHAKLVAAACRRGFFKSYVNWICRFTGDQIPQQAGGKASGKLLLKSGNDFQIAVQRAKQVVRGHDEVVCGVLARIYETVTLRSSLRDAPPQRPLGSFLMVGGEGVGKRFLARVLAKTLYENARVAIFECERLSFDTLIGSKAAPGELLDAVRREPRQALIFEHIEKANAEVLSALACLVTEGKLRARGSTQDVSFQDTTIFFSTTSGISVLRALADESLSDGAWHEQAVERIAGETGLTRAFLNSITQVFFCKSPDDATKAEVVAMLMKKESAAHGVDLSYVDAEILATQVLQIDDTNGFSLVPDRVRKLLRKPLVAAAAQQQRTLSLRLRLPQTNTVE